MVDRDRRRDCYDDKRTPSENSGIGSTVPANLPNLAVIDRPGPVHTSAKSLDAMLVCIKAVDRKLTAQRRGQRRTHVTKADDADMRLLPS